MLAMEGFPSTVLRRNKDGMEALRKGNLQAAFDQFKDAESLLASHSRDMDGPTSLAAVTCNNLGLYYKKVGKLHGALSYLRRALKMEVDLDADEVTLAGTHLNICAILSKLDKHDKAVQHALNALDLISSRVDGQEPDKVPADDYSVLAIAYHNVAVERDFLEQFEKSAEAFRKGYEVACTNLGESHPLAISLGSNRDTVLVKSQRAAKLQAAGKIRAGFKDPSNPPAVTSLPPLGATPRRESQPEAADTMMPPVSARNGALRLDAISFACGEETRLAPAQPCGAGLSMPSLGESVDFRDIPFGTGAGKLLPLTIDADQDAMMSIIEAENMGYAVGKAKNASKDFRPSRMIKGSSRTSRMARRTGGAVNETTHRDAVVTRRHPTAAAKEAYVRHRAATTIQRTWRTFYKYCLEYSEWLSTIHYSAGLIQKVWRSYHVRRQRQDKACSLIQKRMRGAIVRMRAARSGKAITIQRYARGMIVRYMVKRWQKNGLLLTSMVRGGVVRIKTRKRLQQTAASALKIQCAWRQFVAKCRVHERREARDKDIRIQKAATDIQRVFRGHLGRKRFDVTSNKYFQDVKRYKSATKIQAHMRRLLATRRVDVMRGERLDQMAKAATTLRKAWLCAVTRKRYKELLGELASHQRPAVTIQRYARGFLVRNRMWREAVRAEEELWASLEIQRLWRGYLGRVRWEDKLETVWLRETRALTIQRAARGFIARRRVGRMQTRIAREEFERARLRFRSAQRIQAMVRGALVRRSFQRRFNRCLHAAITIQRIQRGHALRSKLWEEVRHIRATMIQAMIRGFLARRRNKHFADKVAYIQREWRRHERKPDDVKRRAHEEMMERQKKALLIQRNYRAHQNSRKVAALQEQDKS